MIVVGHVNDRGNGFPRRENSRRRPHGGFVQESDPARRVSGWARLFGAGLVTGSGLGGEVRDNRTAAVRTRVELDAAGGGVAGDLGGEMGPRCEWGGRKQSAEPKIHGLCERAQMGVRLSLPL
jgi:hypothetical protein